MTKDGIYIDIDGQSVYINGPGKDNYQPTADDWKRLSEQFENPIMKHICLCCANYDTYRSLDH